MQVLEQAKSPRVTKRDDRGRTAPSTTKQRSTESEDNRWKGARHQHPTSWPMLLHQLAFCSRKHLTYHFADPALTPCSPRIHSIRFQYHHFPRPAVIMAPMRPFMHPHTGSRVAWCSKRHNPVVSNLSHLRPRVPETVDFWVRTMGNVNAQASLPGIDEAVDLRTRNHRKESFGPPAGSP